MFAKFFVMSISAFRESFTVEHTFEQSVISWVQDKKSYKQEKL